MIFRIISDNTNLFLKIFKVGTNGVFYHIVKQSGLLPVRQDV